MARYYCSGFDITNAFGHGLGELFRQELKSTGSIVFIPGGVERVEKAKNKTVPIFLEHLKNVGIEFEKNVLITPDFTKEEAKETVSNADMLMLLGGNPFRLKDFCLELDLINALQDYNGLMLGLSAGAMFMSKYIIITPCSEEYPDFQVEEGLNLDGISIYPHNNTEEEEYPVKLVSGDEIYVRNDLLKVAAEYGEFYLIQDHMRESGETDVSLIKATDKNTEYYTESQGKIWIATESKITKLV